MRPWSHGVMGLTLLCITLPSFGLAVSTGLDYSQNLPMRATQPNLELSGDSFRSTSIDSFIEAQMQSAHIAGLSAAIVLDSGLFWTGAYGTANFDTSTPVEIETLFMLASISKLFTGTALMQLWEDGLFDLEDDVSDYLPFNVENPNHPGVPLTFRQLLTHSSSINDNWGFMPYYPGDSPIALGSYLADYLVPGGAYYSTNNFHSWAPGTNWSYCNNAFALNGYLVELLSGMSFPDFCQQEIFIPLGMNETAWHLADLDENHIAMPYYWSGSGYVAYGHYGYSDYPSGQLRTSSGQLGQFLLAFMHGGEWNGARILEEATVEMMLTPQIPEIASFQGIAWKTVPPVWGHNGADQGVSTGMYFDPDEKVGVVVLNSGENSGTTSNIFLELYEYGASVTNLDESTPVLGGIELLEAYPNPFNPSTTISYRLGEESDVQVSIYDTRGRLVRVLYSGSETAGIHTLFWNGLDDHGKSQPSGLYFCNARSRGTHASCRLLLLK